MSFPKGTEYKYEPGSEEAHDFLWNTNGTTIELTHNYGSESKEGPVYHPGNAEGDGFGHLAVSCDDVYAACDELEAKGVTFKKKPDEGRMKVVPRCSCAVDCFNRSLRTCIASAPEPSFCALMTQGLAFAYDPDGYWVEIISRGSAPNAPKFSLAQTMMRIKDPKKSLAFYVDQLGMKLVSERHFGDFSLYFLASLPEGVESPDPATPEASAWVKETLYPSCVPILELTHNHGTENDAEFKYHNGNTEPNRGFGHIGFLVDNIEDSCAALEGKGVEFQKKLGTGGIKEIAFALDPDGYWVEVVPRGFKVPPPPQ